MKNKEIIDRILDDIGEEKENSAILQSIKNDMSDVLVDIFGRAEAPRKNYSVNIDVEKQTLEDFADSDTQWDLILTNFSISSDILEATIGVTNTLLISELSQISTVSFTVNSNTSFPNGAPSGIISVLSENGDSLWTDTFSMLQGEENFTFSPAQSGTNIQLKIEIDVPDNYLSLSIDNLIITKSFNELVMPSDFYVPLEVKFNAGTGKTMYVSAEMQAEEFLKWRPNFTDINTTDSIDVITDVQNEAMTYYQTEENVLYDRKIGYYFDIDKDNRVVLHWKPVFKGVITVYYAFIPTILTTDVSDVQVHRVFTDLLVFGTDVRQIRKKMMRLAQGTADISEGALAVMRINLSEYKNEFDRLLKVFTGWVNKEADTPRILPFSILSDDNMRLE